MPELHPLLAGRWSPHAFDPLATLADPDLDALLEAARWAPSAGNSQPWRYAVGRRDDEAHKRILANLPPAHQRWAGAAAALLVGAHTRINPGGEPLPLAAYDLGQSVAHLWMQAAALGYYVHQITGFDADGLCADLALPPDVAPLVVIAIGRLGDPFELPPDLRRKEMALRLRRPVTELLLPG